MSDLLVALFYYQKIFKEEFKMFKLGDVIIDHLQFGYGAKKNGTPLYALTQLNEATIDITADSTDIKDKDGNLVYRKYSGKTAEVNATNAFINLAVIEAISGADAEIATDENTIQMPIIQTVSAGDTLDITGYVDGTLTVSAIYNGALDTSKTYKLGSSASATEYAIATTKASEDSGTVASAIFTPPTDSEEVEYFVKYTKEVKSGAKISISADKYPKSHELYFKALAVDPCDKESFRAVVIHIEEFIPSPEVSLALQGGDSQTMDYKGAILANTCSTKKVLVDVYFVDEEEEAA
jgi:hypothetical protein